jgi:hypothetical protein
MALSLPVWVTPVQPEKERVCGVGGAAPVWHSVWHAQQHDGGVRSDCGVF